MLRVLIFETRPGALDIAVRATEEVRWEEKYCRPELIRREADAHEGVAPDHLSEVAQLRLGDRGWSEGREPILAFVEAASGHLQHETLLRELTAALKERFVRAFVISTRPHYDSEEAQRFWQGYPVLIGYEAAACLDIQQLRRVIINTREIGEALARTERLVGDERPHRIGSLLRIPHPEPLGAGSSERPLEIQDFVTEYARHRAISLFAGGMGETLVQLRRAARVIADRHSLPTEGERPLFPFGGSLPSAEERFDAIALHLYGARPNALERVPDTGERTKERTREWLRRMRAARPAGGIAPHVLLLGETGSGKTLLARWLHRYRFAYDGLTVEAQEQVDDLFQDLNCAAISPNLIDGELFGGLSGAWTGLNRNAPGSIFCACHGTLFLDEIGEIPLTTQAVLLKYLDDGEYYPVGGHGKKITVPVTVIAATNRPLEELRASGQFRHDLLERFRIRIRVPSLRDRREHLDELADFVLQNPQINPIRAVRPDCPLDSPDLLQRDVQSVTWQALRRLRDYHWPGNFRELEQVLWRAVLQAQEEGSSLLMTRHLGFADGEAPREGD